MDRAMSRAEVLWKLFTSMIWISAFTFGGGYVIITFMKKKFGDELGWIDEQEMLDITAMSQSAPGLIAVNASIMIGWRMAGALGVAAGVLGTVIPPMAVIIALSFFYDAFAANRYVAMALRGMQAGVAAIILDVALSLGRKVMERRRVIDAAVMAGAFAASFIYGANMVIIILAAAVIGVITLEIEKRRRAQ